jgi:rubrerythrin
MVDDAKVKQEIEDDLNYVKEDIKRISQQLKDLTHDLSELNRATMCQHNWKLHTSSFHGNQITYYICTKCGYEHYE